MFNRNYGGGSIQMRWEIIPVHFEGDVMRWRAVLFNEESVIIEEKTFSFLIQAQQYIEEKNNESV